MANGNDPNKPPPNPNPTPTPTPGSAKPGGVNPDSGFDKPPQIAAAVGAAVGGLIGGVVGALIGSGMHH
jgi:hypothetical protein